MIDPSSRAPDPAPVATTQPAPPRPPFLERLSDALQHVIGVLVGSNRRPPRRLKSLLNGTWLGHPLHPVITDIPIATWLLGAIFDIFWLVDGNMTAWAPRAAQVAVLLGLLAALGAYVTGATDWSDTYGSERRTGLIHGLFMSGAVILYAISTVLRFFQSDGQSVSAAVFGFVGLALVLTGAYFGGDMVFRFATGVNHTVTESFVEEYEPVMALAELPEHSLQRVVASGAPLILLRMGDQVYAIGATCTHAGGPLDEGQLQGDVVQCPWHGSRFRMRDGKVLTGPATIRAPRYDVRILDGQVEVKRHGGH
jgi:nitrite reductase/ring-hydroxylating ferredoxin subunit/uncharacterized membrane protein